MKVYVFGNQDVAKDNQIIQLIKVVENEFKNVEFVEVKPNEDLPFVGEDKVVFLDVVKGIDRVRVFTEDDLDKLKLAPRTTVHDFDLGWQLKYLRKLGKLKEVRIIGLPMDKLVQKGQFVKLIKGLVG